MPPDSSCWHVPVSKTDSFNSSLKQKRQTKWMKVKTCEALLYLGTMTYPGPNSSRCLLCTAAGSRHFEVRDLKVKNSLSANSVASLGTRLSLGPPIKMVLKIRSKTRSFARSQCPVTDSIISFAISFVETVKPIQNGHDTHHHRKAHRRSSQFYFWNLVTGSPWFFTIHILCYLFSSLHGLMKRFRIPSENKISKV